MTAPLPAAPPLSDRKALRTEMRARRDAWALAHPGTIWPAPDMLRAIMRPGIVLATYVPLGSEADPGTILTDACAAGCTTALPHVVGRDDMMRFLAWRPGDALVPGTLGLQQPVADAAEVMPDIIIVPLLAVDRDGNRLGQGAGHYDRALARLPQALRVGLCWSVQVVPHLPCAPWDVPLHATITETEVITHGTLPCQP